MDMDTSARLLQAPDCTPGKFVYSTNEQIFGIRLKPSNNECAFLMFGEEPRVRLVSNLDLFLQFDDARLVPDFTTAVHTSRIVIHLPFGAIFLSQETGKAAWLASKNEYHVLVQIEDGLLDVETGLYGVYIMNWKVVLPLQEDATLFEFTAALPEAAA